MNLDQFLIKYDGKFVEVTGSPGAENQCVDLANAYLRDVLNHSIVRWTNAKDFPSKLPDFEWIENTPNGLPERGDLLVWQHNEYGHIAIFLSGNLDSFVSFDQNYPTGSPAHRENHNYIIPRLAGWLRPPESEDMVDPLQECLSQHRTLVDEAIKREEYVERLEIDKKSLEDDVRELNYELEKCESEPVTEPIDIEFGEETGTKAVYDENGVLVGFEKSYKPTK